MSLRTHPSLDLTPVRFQRIPFVAAKFVGADPPGPSPSTDTADAYATEVGSLLVGVTRLDGLSDAASQVIRMWLPHSCWPLSRGKLEPQTAIRWIPDAIQRFRIHASFPDRKSQRHSINPYVNRMNLQLCSAISSERSLVSCSKFPQPRGCGVPRTDTPFWLPFGRCWIREAADRNLICKPVRA